jgi:hypothetical protein
MIHAIKLIGTGDLIDKDAPDFLSCISSVGHNHTSIAKLGGVDPCRGWHKMYFLGKCVRMTSSSFVNLSFKECI